jgi:hypothetical protein
MIKIWKGIKEKLNNPKTKFQNIIYPHILISIYIIIVPLCAIILSSPFILILELCKNSDSARHRVRARLLTRS